jgi:hypothetical protein
MKTSFFPGERGYSMSHWFLHGALLFLPTGTTPGGLPDRDSPRGFRWKISITQGIQTADDQGRVRDADGNGLASYSLYVAEH